DSVSKFENQDKNDKGDGLSAPRVFRNPTLELDVHVAKQKDGQEKLTMVFKDLENRRQSLDFKIRIRFLKDGKPEVIDISESSIGPSGGAGAEQTVVRQLPANQIRNGIYAVEQVLDWRSAPIKRIDAVNIASLAPDESAQSRRTFVDGQQSYRV